MQAIEQYTLQAMAALVPDEMLVRIIHEAKRQADKQGVSFNNHDGRNFMSAINLLRVQSGHLSLDHLETLCIA